MDNLLYTHTTLLIPIRQREPQHYFSACLSFWPVRRMVDTKDLEFLRSGKNRLLPA